MTIRPDDPAAMAAHGRLRASRADREHVIETLNTAFVDGRLEQSELDTRVGQALASRTYADLATLTCDIPPGPSQTPSPRLAGPPRPVGSPRPAAQAAKRGLAVAATVVPPVLFFESVVRGNNETLTELAFLLMLLDLIFLTLAAGNKLLNQLETRRSHAAVAARPDRPGPGSPGGRRGR